MTTIFVYNVAGQLIAEYTSDPVPPPQGGGGPSYLTSDHLGSTRVVTRADGSVKARYDYLPFGEEIGSEKGNRTSVTGYGASDGTRQKFTQKERDNESGLDYFLARYYSPAQGRFFSVDAVRGSIRNSQSWNLYVYVLNNPLKYIDPFGLWEQIAGGVWQWQEGDSWQGLADILHVKKKALKRAFKGAGLGAGLIVDTNNLSPGAPEQIYSDTQLTPLFVGVGAEMNRRANASQNLIVGFGAVNLAPAILASATLSGGTITTLGLSSGGGTVAGLYGTASVATLEGLASSGGATEVVVTNLTQAPAAGQALSVATGHGAEALTSAARAGGQLFRAEIPKALLREMERVGLAFRSTTSMGGATAGEIRFAAQATRFITQFFK